MSKMLCLSMLASICVCMQACFFDEASQSAGGGASFQQDISPLLIQSCATLGCHDGDTASGGLILSLTQEQTPTDQLVLIESLNLIDLETPEQSVLLLQASNADPSVPHTGGEVWAPESAEYKQLLDWLKGGAINDDCTAVAHGFAADVVPVLTTATCTSVGCHGGTSSPNLLENPYEKVLKYVNVKAPWESELLQNALGQNQHGGGVLIESANKPEYRAIYCWIQEDDAANN